MPNRVLTANEKAVLIRDRIELETKNYPGHFITVIVEDKTDERGQPKFIITRMKEKKRSA